MARLLKDYRHAEGALVLLVSCANSCLPIPMRRHRYFRVLFSSTYLAHFLCSGPLFASGKSGWCLSSGVLHGSPCLWPFLGLSLVLRQFLLWPWQDVLFFGLGATVPLLPQEPFCISNVSRLRKVSRLYSSCPVLRPAVQSSVSLVGSTESNHTCLIQMFWLRPVFFLPSASTALSSCVVCSISWDPRWFYLLVLCRWHRGCWLTSPVIQFWHA